MTLASVGLDTDRFPAPRLMAGVVAGRHLSLAEHVHRHGTVPRWRRQGADHPLLAMLDASGLRGRGGAGFPTATKWRAVAGRRRPVIVANGAEGEPASAKDGSLLRHNPHLVLDGAQLAADALHAREIVLWVGASNGRARTVLAALQERAAARLDRVPMRLVEAPDQFLSGEESATVRGVSGGPALPVAVPPRPFERGVDGRPTLVQNVETLAHVALLARYGVDWFRSQGTPDEPGTMLTTVLGSVGRSGVYEIPLGTRLDDLLTMAGGRTERISGYLLGGYHGAWVAPAAREVRMTHGDVRAIGGALGAGLVVALPVSACGLRETARVVDYLARSGARQCGPCMFGLDAIASALNGLATGSARTDDVTAVERWAGMAAGRGGCKHPDGTVRFLRSALTVFARDVAAHADGRPCTRTSAVLPVPPVVGTR